MGSKASRLALSPEETRMEWQRPSFVEVKMDAEISAYQDDFDPLREEPAFVKNVGAALSATASEVVSSD